MAAGAPRTARVSAAPLCEAVLLRRALTRRSFAVASAQVTLECIKIENSAAAQPSKRPRGGDDFRVSASLPSALEFPLLLTPGPAKRGQGQISKSATFNAVTVSGVSSSLAGERERSEMSTRVGQLCDATSGFAKRAKLSSAASPTRFWEKRALRPAVSRSWNRSTVDALRSHVPPGAQTTRPATRAHARTHTHIHTRVRTPFGCATATALAVPLISDHAPRHPSDTVLLNIHDNGGTE